MRLISVMVRPAPRRQIERGTVTKCPSFTSDGQRRQMEGCITMGLGYALIEEMHFKDGEVLEHNFDRYPIPRFSRLPKMKAILIDNAGSPALGARETPVITMGAVIANAIFDAAGVRLRQLPMIP